MRLEHHLVGGYVRYISPHIIIIIISDQILGICRHKLNKLPRLIDYSSLSQLEAAFNINKI